MTVVEKTKQKKTKRKKTVIITKEYDGDKLIFQKREVIHSVDNNGIEDKVHISGFIRRRGN